MATKANIHVISRGKKWAVTRHGRMRAIRLFTQKYMAVSMAVCLSKGECDVIVHYRDGSVEAWVKIDKWP